MRVAFFVIGAILAIAGVLMFTGMFQIGSADEVLQIGDAAVEIGEGGIQVTDKGENNRVLGIALMVIGGIGIAAGAFLKK
ncbi:hypothetical protein ACOPJQ_12595 [Luteimonas dalianensis]|uniref:hypothetical protein n=1 Tax=Luteimonas dalianensis TaxID=1148196 RepID=UPI003BF0ED0D